jgi:hypothetical protein
MEDARKAIPAIVGRWIQSDLAGQSEIGAVLDRIDATWRNSEGMQQRLNDALASLLHRTPEERTVLVQALTRLNPNWQSTEAAQALIPECMQMLERNHSLNKSKVRNAIEVLGLIGDEGVEKRLIAIVGKGPGDLRLTAENSLNAINPQWSGSAAAKEAIPDLVLSLADDSRQVRSHAERILARIDFQWQSSTEVQKAVAGLATTWTEMKGTDRLARLESILEKIDPNWHGKAEGRACIPKLIRRMSKNPSHPEANRLMAGFSRILELAGKPWFDSEEGSLAVTSLFDAWIRTKGPGEMGNLVPLLDQACPAWTSTRTGRFLIIALSTWLLGIPSGQRENCVTVLARIDPQWLDTPEASEGISQGVLEFARSGRLVKELDLAVCLGADWHNRLDLRKALETIEKELGFEEPCLPPEMAIPILQQVDPAWNPESADWHRSEKAELLMAVIRRELKKTGSNRVVQGLRCHADDDTCIREAIQSLVRYFGGTWGCASILTDAFTCGNRFVAHAVWNALKGMDLRMFPDWELQKLATIRNVPYQFSTADSDMPMEYRLSSGTIDCSDLNRLAQIELAKRNK